MTKVKVAPKKEKITAEVLDNELSAIEAPRVKEEAEKTLSKIQLDILKRVAYYVGKIGMDINESCILLGVEPKKFYEEMEKFPIMRRIIDMKELEYKKDLMATLSARGRGGDDKIAQWLLEIKEPEKYGKKKGGGEAPDDMIATAIEFIQNSTPTAGGLVQRTSGRAIVIKQKGEQKMSTADVIKKIHQIAKP